jgi:hypothetical protein
MKKQTAFQKWLITFCQEKQIDMSEPVQGKDGCQLQAGDVLSAMMSASAEEQAQIKQIIVMIDFKNGDVMHFIRHAAQALGPEYKLGV